MKDAKIDVIATSISGSIKDWRKVKHIVPLFNEHGYDNVELLTVDSHAAARSNATECIKRGTRIIISAGGSGTFNSVLEGCCDSGLDLNELQLGFLRKGSADLIGKTLGMPDNINQAIKVFVDSLSNKISIKCDIILAESEQDTSKPRHFVGYGGAEIFGHIPTYTENRFIKYYKGILGQFFGDMGPFFVGACLASFERSAKGLISGKRKWQLIIDDEMVSEKVYQALIIANGDLGKDMPLARSVPLGSGDFYLFGLRDLGLLKLPTQFKKTWIASILDDPGPWGFEKYCIKKSLVLKPMDDNIFKVNIDGATMECQSSVKFRITNQINLIANKMKV